MLVNEKRSSDSLQRLHREQQQVVQLRELNTNNLSLPIRKVTQKGRFRIIEEIIPNTSARDLRFGVEIEVSSPRYSLKRGQESSKFINKYFGLQEPDGLTSYSGWQAVEEDTIAKGCELISPIMSPKHLVQVSCLMQSLASLGTISTDNDAGVHVHVDGSTLRVGQLMVLGKMMANIEPMLYHLLGTDPTRKLIFCRPLNQLTAYSALTQKNHYVAMYRQAGMLIDEDLSFTPARNWLKNNSLFGNWLKNRNFGTSIFNLQRSKMLEDGTFGQPKGTIEFRYFHASSQQNYVESCILLCCSLVRYVQVHNDWQWDNALYNNHGKAYQASLWLKRLLPKLPLAQVRQEMRTGYIGLKRSPLPSNDSSGHISSILMNVADSSLATAWLASMENAVI